MSDPHPAVKKYVATLVSPNQRIETLEARVAELEAALTGVLKSIEAYRYLNDPPTDENTDEYDLMMLPLWERARAALAAEKGEGTFTLLPPPPGSIDHYTVIDPATGTVLMEGDIPKKDAALAAEKGDK